MDIERRGQMPIIRNETISRVVFSIHEDPLAHYQGVKPEMQRKDPTIVQWIDSASQFWYQTQSADTEFISGSVLVWEILHAEDPNLPAIDFATLQTFVAEQTQRLNASFENETFDKTESFTLTSPGSLHDPLLRMEENVGLMDLIEKMSQEFSEAVKPAFLTGAMSIYELIKRQLEAALQKPN